VLCGGMRCEGCAGAGLAEGFEEPAVNGGCGFAVELLVDDGLDQRLEGGLCAGDAEPKGPGALDQFAKFRVGGRKFIEGLRSVIARRTWSGDGAWHM